MGRGRFNLADVTKWRADVLGQRDEGRQDTKAYWQMQKWKLDCRKSEIEISKMSGTVHDKAACAASLTAIRARESGILHGLAQRFAGAFPEAGQQGQWLEREVDEVIGRLRGEG